MSIKLCKNLNRLMTEAGLNAEELSRRIGLPASTIKKIRSNSDANPTLSSLIPIAKYFSLTISQLIGDEAFPTTRIKGAYRPNLETLNYIPLISWEDAVTWPKKQNQLPKHISTEYSYSKDAFALLVEENDWDNLAEGTALLVDPKLTAAHRDLVIVWRCGQKIPTVKKLLCDENQLYLKPISRGYNVIALTPEHQILGVVVEYKKYLRNN